MTQGTLSRRGFIESSTAALVATGVPLWFARQVVADELESKAGRTTRSSSA
jgi:hypothetical protein